MDFDYFQDDDYIVSDKIARKYGIELSALLGYLISVDDSFTHMDNSPWFYNTIEEMEERTGLKRKKQERLLKQLENLGIIKRKLIGLPAKRYFLINYKRVEELAFSKEKLDNYISH